MFRAYGLNFYNTFLKYYGHCTILPCFLLSLVIFCIPPYFSVITAISELGENLLVVIVNVLLVIIAIIVIITTMPAHSDFNQTCGGSEFGAAIISQYAHMRRLPHNSIMRTMTSLNSAGKREVKPISEDNQPARFELFLLGDGEKKVTEEADTREYSSFLQHGEFPHQAAMRSIRTSASTNL